jgi:hypothetical protein
MNALCLCNRMWVDSRMPCCITDGEHSGEIVSACGLRLCALAAVLLFLGFSIHLSTLTVDANGIALPQEGITLSAELRSDVPKGEGGMSTQEAGKQLDREYGEQSQQA